MRSVVRIIVGLVLGIAVCAAAETPRVALRGSLVQENGKPPAIETADHHRVELSGDDSTMKVLNDARLKGADFEALGHSTGAGHFLVDPIHTTALFVHKDGKRLEVTYYCHTCNIRTYVPGKCVCCQQETDLDLIDPQDQ